AGHLLRDGGGRRGRRRGGAAGGGGGRARAHVLARARRPAAARRRRGTARAALDVEAVRRGRRHPRGRRAPRRGVPARDELRHAARRTRAGGGDARDDRRAVPRHHGQRAGRADAPQAEDGPALRRVRRARTLGRACPGGRAGAVARVRRRARPALPDRGRHPRRRRLRRHPRRRRRPPPRGRGRRPRAAPPRRGRRRHERAARDRRLARRANRVIPPSGEQYEIAHGDRRAVVVEVGGGLREYGPLLGYAVDEVAQSGRGAVLMPWPNRIDGGRYEWEGETHQLALTEPAAGNAIHGLARWVSWRAVEHEAARVVVEHVVHPQPGYPFTLRLQVDYALDDDGLSVTTRAENLGDRAAPFGAGHHPYIAAPSGRVDDMLLEGKPIGDRKLDDTTPIEGPWRLQVGDVTVWADEHWSYVQLFTGDDKPDVARRALAVEPMTCPPNAFRTGVGLIRLEPGDGFEARWGIAPQ